MSAADALAIAHKTAAKATGRLSGMLATQKVSSAYIKQAIEDLRSAADGLEEFLAAAPRKTSLTERQQDE